MAMYDLLLTNPWTSLIAGGVLLFVASKLVTSVPLLVAVVFYLPKQRKVERFEHNVVYLYHWFHHWTRQIIETAKPSKLTKQIPYVILNGEEICESSNIIEVLSDHFNVDKTDGLSPEHLAVSRGLQRMVEDSTAWTIFMDRYIYKPDLFIRICRLVKPKVLYTRFQAMLTAGADCTIFGHLCQVVYSVDFPYFHQEALTDDLRAYMDRIKDKLWPDWHIRVNPEPFEN